MIDILPISLLILLFYGAKSVKPWLSLNTEEYLSVNTGKNYRGFFAMVVVFHHLAQRTQTGVVFHEFRLVGYLAVAFFFFLSGYGLQKSYITKSTEYRKGFLQNRIPSVLIPYIIITAVYWLMYFFMGEFYSLKGIIFSIIDGHPIASNSWYIINILIFYIFYWCLMLICGKHYFLMIIFGAIWYYLYIVFCEKMGYGAWWYNANHLLIVGMFWAAYENTILNILERTYVWLAPVIWVSFGILCHFSGEIEKLININIPYISTSLVITIFKAAFFVLSVIMLVLKVQIGNKVLRFLGDISLEIYISHGLFIHFLRSDFIYIGNELLWCTAVLIGTIAFSYALHIIFQFILNKYKQLCCK